MICENAYYPNGTGENREKLYYKDPGGASGFNGKCPFSYYCNISEKYENTADMFECVYRKKEEE